MVALLIPCRVNGNEIEVVKKAQIVLIYGLSRGAFHGFLGKKCELSPIKISGYKAAVEFVRPIICRITDNNTIHVFLPE